MWYVKKEEALLNEHTGMGCRLAITKYFLMKEKSLPSKLDYATRLEVKLKLQI